MIYRRPIRDVVEERHGRTCGVHVFLFYIVALSAVLAMSTACLTATESGYFAFDQDVHVSPIPQGVDASDLSVSYEITYGWKSVCSTAIATYTDESGEEQMEDESGCFGLADTELLDFTQTPIVGGRAMDADTGLAVALGHAVAAAVAGTHILFFLLLYFNIDPAPVRGYLYMRGLGLMAALTSFYLLFTCVVSFFFAIKGSLDINMASSAGLRPSWAYVLTVIDVTLMVIIGLLACQDDEVDAAIATPQYTSSSRDEDTVKLASGKLLHLRSRSSDTVCDNSAFPNNANGVLALASSVAPKATVGGTPSFSGNSSAAEGGTAAAMGGEHPAATAGIAGLRVGVPGRGGGGGGGMSAAASSAAAHAAAASAALGRLASSPAGSGGSGSVLSSWTGGVSALSPRPRRDEEEGGGGGSSPLDGTGSRGGLDAALFATVPLGEGGDGEGRDGRRSGGSDQEGTQGDERRRSGSAGGGGECKSTTVAAATAQTALNEVTAVPAAGPEAAATAPEAGVVATPTTAGVGPNRAGADSSSMAMDVPTAQATAQPRAPDVTSQQEVDAVAMAGTPVVPSVTPEERPAAAGPQSAAAAPETSARGRIALPVFSTARTVVSVAEDDGIEPEETLDDAATGSGGLRQQLSHTPSPSARFSAGDEEV